MAGGSEGDHPSQTASRHDTAGEMAPPKKEINMMLLIFGIVSYTIVSLAVVYFNWWFFTSGFKYPVFISWVQQCVGSVIFFFGYNLSRYFTSLRPIFPPLNPPTPSNFDTQSGEGSQALRSEELHRNASLPSPRRFDLYKFVQVVPLSVTFVLTIGLANICLQKTLISTYQVARSLTLLFVIVLSYLILHQKQSYLVLFACGIMVVGFIIGSLDPKTLSLGGLLAGAFSSFFQSLYNVLIKKTLPVVGDDNQRLLNYNVLLSSVLFIPMCFAAEDLTSWKTAFGLSGGDGTPLVFVWGGMVLSGFLGTALNMTQYLLVNVTSPLTFNIVGFAKSILQSLGGILFLGDAVSKASASGLGLCILGSGLYAKAKAGEQGAARTKDDETSSLVIEDEESIIITPPTTKKPENLLRKPVEPQSVRATTATPLTQASDGGFTPLGPVPYGRTTSANQ